MRPNSDAYVAAAGNVGMIAATAPNDGFKPLML
jgi:hypothetical protein